LHFRDADSLPGEDRAEIDFFPTETDTLALVMGVYRQDKTAEILPLDPWAASKAGAFVPKKKGSSCSLFSSKVCEANGMGRVPSIWPSCQNHIL
jgi:hypothetical protein